MASPPRIINLTPRRFVTFSKHNNKVKQLFPTSAYTAWESHLMRKHSPSTGLVIVQPLRGWAIVLYSLAPLRALFMLKPFRLFFFIYIENNTITPDWEAVTFISQFWLLTAAVIRLDIWSNTSDNNI